MQTPNFRRTEPAQDYQEPSDSDIHEYAERVGLTTYSPDFAKDLANIASGGRIIPSIEWHDKLKDSDFVKHPHTRVDGEYVQYAYDYGDGYTYYTDEKETAQRYAYENAKRAQESVCEFMRGINFDNVPGQTPLEKSCNLLKTIYDSDVCDGDMPTTDYGELLPAFIEGRGDKASDKTNYLFDTIESLDSVEEELLIEDKSDIEGGEGHGDDNSLSHKVKLAEDMSKGAQTWLEVSRELEKVVRFRISKSDNKTPDKEGDDCQNRQIKSLMELGRIPAVEYALPQVYRLTRAITRATQVRERVARQDNQQLIYMLIDCSGSMKYNQGAIPKAGGVLFNRLKAVIKEEAVMRFRFFDTKLFPEHVAETPEQAREVMEVFKNGSYSGGGTDIDSCLKEAVERIETLCEDGTFSEKPELVIVTDGADRIYLQKSDFSKYNLKLHAFVVAGENRVLAQLARDTGGVASQGI